MGLRKLNKDLVRLRRVKVSGGAPRTRVSREISDDRQSRVKLMNLTVPSDRMRRRRDSGLGEPNTMSTQDLIEGLIRRPVQR
jgi:hypothetical protein